MLPAGWLIYPTTQPENVADPKFGAPYLPNHGCSAMHSADVGSQLIVRSVKNAVAVPVVSFSRKNVVLKVAGL